MSMDHEMKSDMKQDPVVLTVEESAELLRISRGLAYEMVRQGSLPSIRLGRRILVPRRALERMLGTSRPEPVGEGENDGKAMDARDGPPTRQNGAELDFPPAQDRSG